MKATSDNLIIRSYAVVIQDDSDAIRMIENMIAKVRNEQNIDRTKAITQVFLAGAEVLNKDPRYNDPFTDEARVIAQAVFDSNANKLRTQRLNTLYERYGLENFVNWCNDHNIDPASTIESFTMSMDESVVMGQSSTSKMIAWLRQKLSDGEPHSVNEIFDDATADSVLPDPLIEPDTHKRLQQNMRSVASKLGYTSNSRRGMWQMSK